MAKKLSVPEAIIASDVLTSDSKLLIAHILDKAEYGEDGHVDIGGLRSQIGLRGDRVKDALQNASIYGRLHVDQRTCSLDAATSFGIRIDVVIVLKAHESANGQKQIPFGNDGDSGDATQRRFGSLEFGDGPVRTSRRELGTQFFIHDKDNTRHDVTIKQIEVEGSDGGAGYELKVFIRDVGSDAEPINPVTAQFPNADEAWDWWDRYMIDHDALKRAQQHSEAPFSVFKWARGLAEDAATRDNNVIVLGPEAFLATATELGIGLDVPSDELVSETFTYTFGEPLGEVTFECAEGGLGLPEEYRPAPEPLIELDIHEWLYDKSGPTDIDKLFEVKLLPEAFIGYLEAVGKDTDVALDIFRYDVDGESYEVRVVPASEGLELPALCEDCPRAFDDLNPDDQATTCGTCLLPLQRTGYGPGMEEIAAGEVEGVDPEPEPKGLTEDDTDPYFEFTLEDGTPVTVRMRANGGGWNRVVVRGDVNDSQEQVSSVRTSDIGADRELWAKAHCEILRKKYLGMASGAS